MPPQSTASFKSWLKQSTNMKLSSDAAVNRILYEGITNYVSLLDFDTKSIQGLPAICIKTIPAIAADNANNIAAEPEVPEANISSISVRRLIVAVQASKYYDSIGRPMDSDNMHYNNVLSDFKIDWDTYVNLKSQDSPEVPLVNDKDSDRRGTTFNH